MHINVGPFRYHVRLVHGHILHDGEPCFGLCDNLQQQILLSDVPPPHQRLQVFFHELMHAWWYHFQPDTSSEESIADLVGIAMTDFLLQAAQTLRDQGTDLGLTALLSHPAPTVSTKTPPHTPASPRDHHRQPTPLPRRAPLPSTTIYPATAAHEPRWTIHIYDPAP
jgi:hypothetical protein